MASTERPEYFDNDRPVSFNAELADRFAREMAADLASMEAAGALTPPDDPDAEGEPRFLCEDDFYDDLPPMSAVDALEWELWAGVDQDEAERAMLRRDAPDWVFLPPGAALAAALEPVRPQYESPIALIELMKAASRLSSWAESIKLAAMASFYRQRKAQHAEQPRPSQIDNSGRPIDPERSWAAEIAAALHLTTDTAGRHIDTALHLTGPLTATHTALKTGALTWSKALSISESTRSLPDSAAQAVESHVLRNAHSQTHANLRRSLRKQVAKHAAATEAASHREAVHNRTCKIVPLSDGMAGLWVVNTADKIQQMWVVVQALANLAKRPAPTTPPTPSDAPPAPTPSAGPTTQHRPASPTATDANADDAATDANADDAAADAANGDTDAAEAAAEAAADAANGDAAADADAGSENRSRDERTAEQRRADVVADLFEQVLHNGIDWLGRRLPDQHRRRPHIEVLIPANTLLGLDDDPCELTGYGPIPAELARRIAADGTWRRLLTDPTNGTVLEASIHRHDPGALVSETLLARHPTCAWPGCNRAARECDRDHGTPFAQSRRTSLSGLAPYCEYHHVIKDTPDWGWTTTNHPDGSITLTAPTGHRYTTVPPPRGPVTNHPTLNQRPPGPTASEPAYPHGSPSLQRPGTEQVHRTHGTDLPPF
ncbi:HNH endonuclease [Kribbella soli]